MNHPVRTFTLRLLAGAFFFSACSKPDATPQTGIITGEIIRPDAIAAITVSPTSGAPIRITPVITPGSDVATFSFPNLAPGSYQLSYTPEKDFVAPPAQTATVKVGETTTLPLMLVPFTANNGSISFAVNGKSTAAVYVNGSFTGSIFTLIGQGYGGKILLLGQQTSVPGTYTLTGNFGTSPRSYTHNVTSGTLTITNKDQTNRRVSGTFSAAGTAADGSGTGTVTNGVFTDLLY
ncbi:hypothetical protein MON38_08345 [Hymenobacter sp. DH14]|uniref:Uncharacterized protein n=1 Tax=Hymenobacter cyanobacteriorum TaxID=2926463 RepID=A0A9X1VFY9_9BACT|nr:hypothetical protein [Hymenobacter cyanobacteriorum]MCI1187428.1 hypothetical protein [Hymenobacter cyanobacteriorum]